ncbi:MAG: Rossmann fold nucleotide-binding protein [Olpidium bornovanus]|uniref:Rossmann fold nucleotide-binding protein n=1 Tax=Olpidium bornovanus TaxID=278681 RepID=A0A8H7ZV47_9FUNG|nr:MAG: Rossmann fold nucleotide-binding protein [Olpidium bornovanus]
MSASAPIKEFFSAKRFAVVGASAARDKFGNKVLRWYKENNYPVTPVNPKENTVRHVLLIRYSTRSRPAQIESLDAVSSLEDLGGAPADYGVSVVTPPAVTRAVLKTAAKRGFKRLWLQPGSEDHSAVKAAREKGLLVIADGNCVLRNGITNAPKL